MSKHDPSQLCKDTLRPIFVSFPQVQLWWDLQPLPLRHGLCHQGWLHWNLRCFALGDCKAASKCVNLTTPKDASKKVLQRIRRARDGYILLFDFFDFFCCFVSSCLCKGSLFYLFWFLITLITIYPKKPPYVYAISSYIESKQPGLRPETVELLSSNLLPRATGAKFECWDEDLGQGGDGRWVW
jgi:hypothetical protein